MDYSCGLGPHLGGSLRRGSNIRRSISSSKYIGGIDWHLRTQFLEQAKCLELKLDIDCTVLAELQDFYRRRAVVEQDYADALAKLANGVKQRHINETSKRPHWTPYTTTTIWNTLLGSTLRVSEAHATLSDLFSKQMVQRLADMDEDATRLHKQCREMMSTCQNRVLADTAKLQADQREYSQRQAATLEADRARRRAEDKLLVAEQKARSKGKDPSTSQRYQRAQNEYASKQMSYMSTTVATARARNDYLIQLAATNHSVTRYFSEEAPDIIDCLACGFHNSLARSAMMHLSCEEALKTCHSSIVEMLNRNITALDWRQDKALFLKRNEQGFSRPGAFIFVPSKEDNESIIRADGVLREGLEKTATQLMSDIDKLRASTEETWKTLEEVEKKLLELINQKDYDVSRLFITERPRRRRSLNTSTPMNGTSATAASGNGTSVTGSLMTLASSSSAQPTSQSGGGGGGRCNSPSLSQQSANSSEQLNTSGTRAQTPSTGSLSRQGIDESAAGLYVSLRAAYRDARIAQEKAYLDGFASYTQEMHQCQVMQVKVAEIRHALSMHPSVLPVTPPQAASIAPTSGTASGVRCGVAVLPRTSTSKSRSEPPQTQLFNPTPITLPSSQHRHDDFSLSPPPPPPAPHNSRPLATGPLQSPSSPYSNGNSECSSPGHGGLVSKPPSRRVLRVPNVGKPKLFGGTIDEYVEATKQEIPCILLSCTRVIVQFGMHQQGIFRVSGSQTEINEFKAAFERGEDPLVDVREARDINSTAGLFKLYFRELGEPPFHNSLFLSLIECTRDRSDVDDMARRLRQVVIQGLSRPVFVVMRFLFAFLSHVSEHADENMMDAYNLAICFGPSLLPVPSDLNQVHYQTSVIDLVKTFITHHVLIFDPMVPGPVYVKHAIPSGPGRGTQQQPQLDASALSTSCSNPPGVQQKEDSAGQLQLTCVNRMASEVADAALKRNRAVNARKQLLELRGSDTSVNTKSSSVGDLVDVDRSADHTSSVDGGDVAAVRDVGDNSCDDLKSISDSEENSETAYTLAVAQADFAGSTSRELSFQQGDDIFLYRRLNDHWWEGQLATDATGTRGLVPHLYVIPKAALACLAELSADGTMDQSQYDGIGENEEDDDNEDDEEDDEEEEEEDDDNQCKCEDVEAEPTAKGDSSRITTSGEDALRTGAEDHKPTSDTFSATDPPEPLFKLPVQSPSVTSELTEARDSRAFNVSTHSTTVLTSPSNTSCRDAAVHGRPQDVVILDKHKTDDLSASPVEAELSPSSPSPPKASSPSAIHRTAKPLSSSESPRSASLRHTVNYPLSGSLGAVPEDETVASSDYSYSSPAHRQSSTGVECDTQGRFTFASDIDSALAEVMRGLSSLEQADSEESDFRTLERTRELTRKLRLPCAKHAPDLVMDLPVQAASIDPSPAPGTTSGFSGTVLLLPDGSKSSADNFAEQGMDTMRKRPEPRTVLSRGPIFTRRDEPEFKTRFSKLSVSPPPATEEEEENQRADDLAEKTTDRTESQTISAEQESRNISIAARVAAFEANKSQCDSSFTRSVPRPPLAPKPRRS